MVFEKQDIVISKLTWKDKLRTFLSENLENQSWRNFEYQITVHNSQNQMVPNHSKKQKNNQELALFNGVLQMETRYFTVRIYMLHKGVEEIYKNIYNLYKN